MSYFLPLLIVLLLRTCAAQYCNYDIYRLQEIICMNITTLAQIENQINATLIQDKSLTELIEVVKLRQCELSQFTVQSVMFLPQLKEIKIFDSTIAKLSYEENNDETDNDVRTITITNSRIKFIDPKVLHGLRNILKLDLQNNEIVAIISETFSRSTVEELLLQNNKITTIQFDNLNNLEYIMLAHNEIKRVNVTTFKGPRMRKLDLSHNQIDFIEPGAFNSLNNLRRLNLDFNSITKLADGTFYGSSIGRLRLNWNGIKDLGSYSFAEGHFENLMFLDNRITEISKKTFSGCTVTWLYLSPGEIEIIERNSFDNVSSLRFLTLNSNRISNINASAFSIPSLEVLSLDNNSITNIESGAFNGASNLRELRLGSNKLNTVKKNTFSGTSLQTLSLAYNQIRTIEPYAFVDLNNLTSLDLSGNRISRIDEKVLPPLIVSKLFIGDNPQATIQQGIFGKFYNLQKLDLHGLNMDRIPLISVSLLLLHFDYNNVSSIKASDFQFLNNINSKSNNFSEPALETIFLTHSNISTIEPYAFSGLRRLRELYLHSNKLGKIDKYSFAQSTIEELVLERNGITLIDPGAFCGLNLSTLLLNENELTKIERNTFAGCSIKRLGLQRNKVEIIEPYAFSDVRNLYVLNLNSNRITKIGRNIFLTSTIKILDLYENNISSLSAADFEQLSNLESTCFLFNSLHECSTRSRRKVNWNKSSEIN